MNKVTIEFDEKGLKYQVAEPLPLEHLFQIMLNVMVAATDNTAEWARKEDPQFDEAEFRHTVFDKLNAGLTSILVAIDPLGNQHPNLTEVAILLAENTLLQRADMCGMSVEEYLPIAKAEQEKEFKVWKMNEKARIQHTQKLRKEVALKAIKGGKN